MKTFSKILFIVLMLITTLPIRVIAEDSSDATDNRTSITTVTANPTTEESASNTDSSEGVPTDSAESDISSDDTNEDAGEAVENESSSGVPTDSAESDISSDDTNEDAGEAVENESSSHSAEGAEVLEVNKILYWDLDMTDFNRKAKSAFEGFHAGTDTRSPDEIYVSLIQLTLTFEDHTSKKITASEFEQYGIKLEKDPAQEYVWNILKEGLGSIIYAPNSNAPVALRDATDPTGSFTIYKKDIDGKPLANAQFTLSRRTQGVPSEDLAPADYSDRVVFTKVSEDPNATELDRNAGINFADLKKGVYTLSETKSPSGYWQSRTDYVIVVQDDGTTYIVPADSYDASLYPVDHTKTFSSAVVKRTSPKDISSEIIVNSFTLDNATFEAPRTTVYPNSNQYLSLDTRFKLPDDVIAGDTFTITIDSKLLAQDHDRANEMTRSITSIFNNEIATLTNTETLTDGKTKYTYTLTNYVDNNKNIYGKLKKNFYIDRKDITTSGEQDFLITIGSTSQNSKIVIEYAPHINVSEDDYVHVETASHTFVNDNGKANIYTYVKVDAKAAAPEITPTYSLAAHNSRISFDSNTKIKLYELTNAPVASLAPELIDKTKERTDLVLTATKDLHDIKIPLDKIAANSASDKYYMVIVEDAFIDYNDSVNQIQTVPAVEATHVRDGRTFSESVRYSDVIRISKE